MPTQEGWTEEGKVIPISDKTLELRYSLPHTHFTLAGHIHQPTNVKHTQICTVARRKYKQTTVSPLMSTRNSCRTCSPPFSSPRLYFIVVFPSPPSASPRFTYLLFVTSNSCSSTRNEDTLKSLCYLLPPRGRSLIRHTQAHVWS